MSVAGHATELVGRGSEAVVHQAPDEEAVDVLSDARASHWQGNRPSGLASDEAGGAGRRYVLLLRR